MVTGCVSSFSSLFWADAMAEPMPTSSSLQIRYQNTFFFCDGGDPSTLVTRTDLGNADVIVFESSFGEWTPLLRCQEIARRLTEFYNDRNLAYLTWARSPGGGRVINVAKYEGDILRSEEFVTLLLTLKLDDLPHEIIAELTGIISTFGDLPIRN